MGRGALAMRISGPAPRHLMRTPRERRDAFLAQVGSRPLVMGILNITPDSFSDGGQFMNCEAAVDHARRLVADGADIIDIGGESTRPAASPVAEADELARVTPVLERIGVLEAPLSIDTYKSAVAARAIALGAILVNDPWGLQKDPAMADTVAAGGAAVVVMHNRGEKDETIDIVDDMRHFFDRSLALAAKAGIPERHIILDPGIGFAKTSRQNLAALSRLRELESYGRPLLVGVSRKGFLGQSGDDAEETPFGTVAAALAAFANGAAILRVHDVAAHAAALKVFHAIMQGVAR
jgi:dihydropteroate synthase